MNSKLRQALRLLDQYILEVGADEVEAQFKQMTRAVGERIQEFHRRHDVPNTRYVEITHNSVKDYHARSWRAQYVDPARPPDVTFAMLNRIEFLSRQGIRSAADLDDVL